MSEPRFRIVFMSEEFDAFGVDVVATTRQGAILLAAVEFIQQGRTPEQQRARRRAVRSKELTVEVHDRLKPKWGRGRSSNE